MSKLKAGAADAHTWISENSAPHGSEQRFKDGWHAGVRDVATHLLRIADATAATGARARRLQRHVGVRIANQRSRAATLSPERVELLSAIGMRWA
ncbi:hypothetical protein [Streptomyces mexicanus]|uniref:hypothetical protein n=1 Tax=Streptomyces mexicanus TaxID=178566 RepID=UPI00364FF514